MENSVITILKRRIQELGLEARKLVGRRDHIHSELHDIDIRLTHITGAISEMDQLIKKEEAGAAKNSSESTADQGVSEADDMQPADDNGVQDQEDCGDSGCGDGSLRQPPEGFAG